MLQSAADILSRFGAFFWLTLTIPALLVSVVAAGEGHRLVVLSRQTGNIEAPGARLLRLVGVGLSVVLCSFALVGIIAIFNLVSTPFVSVPMTASVNIRRISGSVLFFITPPTLGYVAWRVLKFLSPKPDHV